MLLYGPAHAINDGWGLQLSRPNRLVHNETQSTPSRMLDHENHRLKKDASPDLVCRNQQTSRPKTMSFGCRLNHHTTNDRSGYPTAHCQNHNHTWQICLPSLPLYQRLDNLHRAIQQPAVEEFVANATSYSAQVVGSVQHTPLPLLQARVVHPTLRARAFARCQKRVARLCALKTDPADLLILLLRHGCPEVRPMRCSVSHMCSHG
mmetsp:Transcript_38922/g.64065  ORF Transcript_38922/g.64065 Transcript_38922/m.64065 type:complete len:206 (+) Transcript_38922:395-1012(+)